MGIDDKFIMNLTSDTKVSKSVKRPTRKLEEIQKVSMNQSKSNEFQIKYKDQTYKYESPQAEEIVAKITFLLKMREEGKQREERLNS